MALCAGAHATAARSEAQTDWRVDAALTRVHPAGASRTLAGSISAVAQQQIGRVTPTLSGAATIAGDSVAAAQLLMGVSVLPPWTVRAPIDVGAIVALYGIASGDRGQSRTLYARQHLLYDHGGYWLGAAVGQIDRAVSFGSNAVDIGAWIATGRARFTVSASTTRTDDHAVFQNTALVPDPLADKVRVADASVTVQLAGDRVDAEGSFGARFAVEGIDGSRMFATAAVGVRVSRTVRLVVSAGSQLADPLRGTPEWRFASAGVRIANGPLRRAVARGPAAPPLDATRLDDGRVRIFVAAPPTAERVEITGTPTSWEPVALVRGAGGWEVTVRAEAGPHRLQVRVNGLEWRVPANLPSVLDEFGGRAGLIVFP